MNRYIQKVSRAVVTLPLVMLLSVGHAASDSVRIIEQDLLKAVDLLDDQQSKCSISLRLKDELSKSVKEITWATKSAKSKAQPKKPSK